MRNDHRFGAMFLNIHALSKLSQIVSFPSSLLRDQCIAQIKAETGIDLDDNETIHRLTPEQIELLREYEHKHTAHLDSQINHITNSAETCISQVPAASTQSQAGCDAGTSSSSTITHTVTTSTERDVPFIDRNCNGIPDEEETSYTSSNNRSAIFTNILGAIILVVGFSYIIAITWLPIPEDNQRFADTCLGFILGSLLATVINFFFGSSMQTTDFHSVVQKTKTQQNTKK